MALTLRELLLFDVVRAAKPDVLAGDRALDRPVRWVHSSEIYEIGPLLSGGELLLTTGLGLAGSDAGARRHYVREIAQRGITGLAIELGRTFPDMPEELVDEARRFGLPLIALRAVVPFIKISEAANTAIVDEAARRLRLGDQVSRALNEALISGAGVAGLLRTAADVADAPLMLVTATGALVASYGVPDDHAAWQAVDEAVAQAQVVVHGRPWGRVVAGPGSPLAAEDLAATVDRTAMALTVEILRTGDPPTERERHAAALLGDLLSDLPGGGSGSLTDSETAVRAGLAGFRPPPDRDVLGVAVDAPETRPAIAIIDHAARLLGTTALRARVRDAVLALVVAPVTAVDVVGAVESVFREATQRSGAPQITVALGHGVGRGPVAEADGRPAGRAGRPDRTAVGWTRTLRDARAALGLALSATPESRPLGVPARPGGRPVVLSSRAVGLELELTRHNDPEGLDDLVRRTIGPLVAWDAAHRTGLVHTLELFLRNGCSATRTAEALHLRRQSFYQRLSRIETLLGHPVNVPDLYPALLAAACAYRLSQRPD
jgi:purine catabolism regulator